MSAYLDQLPEVFRRKPVGHRFRDRDDDRMARDCGATWLAKASAEYLDKLPRHDAARAEACVHQAAQLLELSRTHDEWNAWWAVFRTWARRVAAGEERERSRARRRKRARGGDGGAR